MTRAIAALAAAVVLQTAPAPRIVEHPGSRLRTWEVGGGATPFVLLHGYGSTPQEWLPFAATIVLPSDDRFVFPEGPESTTPPDGPAGGRAWWRLDLAKYRRASDRLPDLTARNPPQLRTAAARVRKLLQELGPDKGSATAGRRIGGFSQGAMIAAEIAFASDEPLDTLVLLSPTLVDDRRWRAAMPRRRGLRVFVSHGRRDVILPFDVTERMQREMREAGLAVTWAPFDGGHEMPAEVVTALNAVLAR
jgi:phospholipase/carboxylesterase